MSLFEFPWFDYCSVEVLITTTAKAVTVVAMKVTSWLIKQRLRDTHLYLADVQEPNYYA